MAWRPRDPLPGRPLAQGFYRRDPSVLTGRSSAASLRQICQRLLEVAEAFEKGRLDRFPLLLEEVPFRPPGKKAHFDEREIRLEVRHPLTGEMSKEDVLPGLQPAPACFRYPHPDELIVHQALDIYRVQPTVIPSSHKVLEHRVGIVKAHPDLFWGQALRCGSDILVDITAQYSHLVEKAQILVEPIHEGGCSRIYLPGSLRVYGGVEIRYLFDNRLVYRLDLSAVDKLDPNLALEADHHRGEVPAGAEGFEVALDSAGEGRVADDKPLEALPIDGDEVQVVRLLQPGAKEA